MGSLAKQLGGQSDVKVFKKGGSVKHSDAKQDMAMLKKAVKPSAMRKKGGRAPKC